MKRNAYSEINFHINWHTKQNRRILDGVIEERLHRFLAERVISTPNTVLQAIGGTSDHVHLAVAVPPTLLVSDWIGKLKGASSFYMNQQLAHRQFLQWQEGYGIVSFGSGELKRVVEYVCNQREHHARGSLVDQFERTWREC